MVRPGRGTVPRVGSPLGALPVKTTLFVVMESGVVIARPEGSRWMTSVALPDRSPLCIAVDPQHPARVYCGTAGDGLWRSDDVGSSWRPVGPGITHARVTAVSVGANARAYGTFNAIYAGTSPSAVFRSTDGGGAWHECPGLNALPSASSWSFPPRPETHHVRWIGIDPLEDRRLFVCIEAGALVRSTDGGETWHDRTPDGPLDTHTLATHDRAPGRLYAAAGDGYFESVDWGETWRRRDAGLRHRYVWDVAVDAADPETIVVTAAGSARQAHRIATAESLIYRRGQGTDWRPVSTGLPQPMGTTIGALASHKQDPGVVYASNNHGVYRSADAGATWARLDVPWAEPYRRLRVRALCVTIP